MCNEITHFGQMMYEIIVLTMLVIYISGLMIICWRNRGSNFF